MTPVSAATSRNWVTLNADALRANVCCFGAQLNGAVMAVVKADAYGHGAGVVSRICAEAGMTHFAVATVTEAVELRAAVADSCPDANLYLLSPFLEDEAETIAALNLIPMLSSREQLSALQQASLARKTTCRAFLMVDTGMGREGAIPEEALGMWQQSHERPGVSLTGIATHFSSADEPEGEPMTREQAHRLLEVAHICGDTSLTLSLHNSPATLLRSRLPDAVYGWKMLYRAGLLLYGIEPFRGAFAAMPGLLPVLEWHARVTLVKSLPTGHTVGYGRTHTLIRPSTIATVAVGYADGLDRRLSNRGTLLLQGKRFPIVGRVSMDQCQVDVTEAPLPVRVGDVATVVGTDGTETQTVLDLAEQAKTIPHTIPCALTRRVGRFLSQKEPDPLQPKRIE
ncbi:MAG: alanine racemase [Armatimonadaceae bacterium]